MTLYNKSIKGYKKVQIGTASKEKLLIMVYDGTLKNLYKGKILMEKGMFDRAVAPVMNASSGVVELISTLNHDQAPEICDSLKKLYLYVLSGLSDAVKNNTVQEVNEAIEIISSLKKSWEEAFSGQESESLKKTG